MSQPRIVSLVPSWTETLVRAGANLVGRTHFCIHPETRIQNIPAFGGTKRVDWAGIRALKPDLIILDKEENPERFASEAGCALVVTHVSSLATAESGTRQLAEATGLKSLVSEADRWAQAQSWPKKFLPEPPTLRWLRRPEKNLAAPEWHYLIWKDPWLEVCQGTFISDMLSRFGVALPPARDNLYPEISQETRDGGQTILMGSSEPFPFHNQESALLNHAAPGIAWIDGEVYSWFGIRSLEFLERELKP